MKTGKILDNVGFTKVYGVTRELTIMEQVRRVAKLPGADRVFMSLGNKYEVNRDALLTHGRIESMSTEEMIGLGILNRLP